MDRPTRPQNVMLVDIDLQGYGSREDHLQASLQSDLVTLIDESAAASGLDRKTWARQLKGDEELSAIPFDGSEFRIVDSFLTHLGAATCRLNSGRNEAGRIRLRCAVHEGVISPASAGWASRAVIDVTRMVNSAALRAALKEAPDAVLAVLVSRSVFERTVRAGHSARTVGEFRRVEVREKEFRDEAWLWTYPPARRDAAHGEPSPTTEAVASAGDATRTARARGAAAHTVQAGRDARVFNFGDVAGTNIHIGDSHG